MRDSKAGDLTHIIYIYKYTLTVEFDLSTARPKPLGVPGRFINHRYSTNHHSNWTMGRSNINTRESREWTFKDLSLPFCFGFRAMFQAGRHSSSSSSTSPRIQEIKSWELPSGDHLHIGSESFRTPEPLFQPALIGLEDRETEAMRPERCYCGPHALPIMFLAVRVNKSTVITSKESKLHQPC